MCIFLLVKTKIPLGLYFVNILPPSFNEILLPLPPIEWLSISRLALLSGPTKSCVEICRAPIKKNVPCRGTNKASTDGSGGVGKMETRPVGLGPVSVALE